MGWPGGFTLCTSSSTASEALALFSRASRAASSCSPPQEYNVSVFISEAREWQDHQDQSYSMIVL